MLRLYFVSMDIPSAILSQAGLMHLGCTIRDRVCSRVIDLISLTAGDNSRLDSVVSISPKLFEECSTHRTTRPQGGFQSRISAIHSLHACLRSGPLVSIQVNQNLIIDHERLTS